MGRSAWGLLGAVALVGAGAPADAHEHGMPMPTKDVGHVTFANACSAAAQSDLNQGVALLYSFWFPQARAHFEAAARAQPGCAIAWWGMAMSNYEQIEGGGLPEGDQLKAGLAALAKARAAPLKSAREQAYIDALAIIFDAAATPDHDTRVRRFSAAMGAISRRYPDDRQAAVIYAMSLLKDGMPNDPDLALARQALTILNGVLKTEPDNPGVVHFIIHAADNPRMASYGLEAARRYAKVAPAAPHALHMPGHIFARLGLWDEDIRSNLASKAAAEQPSLIHTEAQDRLHAMEFLQYAYLQVGRVRQARTITKEAATVLRTDFSPGFQRYHDGMEAGFRARMAIETPDWAAAVALTPASDENDAAQRIIFWANVVGAGHRKDAAQGRRAEAAYRATFSPAQLAAADKSPSATFAEVKAWRLFAEGDADGAVAVLGPAADRQDRLGKNEVELPAREMLGDMLRLAGRPAEALEQYKVSLKTDPNRLNTLLHAGEVARTLGLTAEAARYRRLLPDGKGQEPRP
jgi:tetratricopeptide (TPR) repeat protein